MELDIKFGKIINIVARYFVAQYEANCIDLPVTIYIFSDLVILSQKDCNNK